MAQFLTIVGEPSTQKINNLFSRLYRDISDLETATIANDTIDGAIVSLISAKSIAASTDVIIPWETAIIDTGSFWNSGTPTRLIIPVGKAGIYLLNFSTRWTLMSVNATLRHLLLQNGATINRDEQSIDNTGTRYTGNITGIVDADAGDYFELQVRHASGLAESLTETKMQIVRLGSS